jgi:hypothetical protein
MSAKPIVLALAASLLVVTANAAAPSPPRASDRPEISVPPPRAATLGMALMSAVVNAQGTLVRGAGAVSTTGGDGQYEVVFDRNVTACAYTASVASPDTDIPADGASVVLSVLIDNPNALFVRITQDQVGFALRPFQVIVFCAR